MNLLHSLTTTSITLMILTMTVEQSRVSHNLVSQQSLSVDFSSRERRILSFRTFEVQGLPNAVTFTHAHAPQRALTTFSYEKVKEEQNANPDGESIPKCYGTLRVAYDGVRRSPSLGGPSSRMDLSPGVARYGNPEMDSIFCSSEGDPIELDCHCSVHDSP